MATAIETKLYVTNFPSSATRQQLQQFFSRFGRVQECAIMWNSYAFVHYASMDEARRALDQSNGAMFLNRKLIVQLSTSRFRPQPKDINTSVQPPKQLMMMTTPSSSSSISFPSDESTVLPAQYSYSDMMTSTGFRQQSPSLPDNSNIFRPPSPLSQNINAYYSSIPLDRMTTPSPFQINPIQANNTNVKTDFALSGELPKLYCTNLPDNCKANDLQRLFSSFGHVMDCVILWDYYAFITFQNFHEAERALIALNGFSWKDRRLIVEWSRASGRRQQLEGSTPPRLGSFASEVSTPPSPRARPSTLLTHSSASNNQFYGNNSPKILPSPLKSQSPHHTFNQNLALMSIMQQQQQQQQQQQPAFLHSSMPFHPFKNGNNTNDNQQIFDSLTNSSSNHRLDLSPYVDTNSTTLFSSSSELNTPSSTTSASNIYQPSDIVALLEPSSSDASTRHREINDITNTVSSTANSVPPSCSSAALFQENLLSSLFNSFEPFSKLFPNDEQASSSRYNHFSPLLTTAPVHSHYPTSYGHNSSWR